MMLIVEWIILMFSLLCVVCQDFKTRMINVFFPLIIFCFSAHLLWKRIGVVFWDIVLVNTAFFLIIFSLLFIYISIKNKTLINPFKNYFGLGDFIFFICITPFFSGLHFLMYFVFSMIFSIFCHLMFKSRLLEDSIPLAGCASLLLLLVLLSDCIFKSDFIIII